MDRIHVHLEEGAKCWFTSDQHFCHSNVMNFCNRPWSDVKEMNKALTDNWNEVVGEKFAKTKFSVDLAVFKFTFKISS